jgi:hypothetical protein
MGQAAGQLQTSHMGFHTFLIVELSIVGAVITSLGLLVRVIANEL